MKHLLILLALGASLHAAEYFTAHNGSDIADGLSEKSAFATVAKGVSGLKPGDTLTILPGTYFESVSAKISGAPDAPITIRAQRPGTVLLRGDVDAPAFRPADGMRRTFVADFKQRIEGIAERSTFRLYEPVISTGEVEQANATCFQDETSGLVYIHTSDSAPPDCHALAISVTNGFGILLMAPTGSPTVHDVVIDGLAFTGYQARDYPPEPGSRSRWGVAVVRGENITIRRCASFLNSGGFYLLAPVNSLVEDCSAFGNSSRFQTLGNNILGWGVSDTTFRRNVVESFWSSGSSAGDITFYGGGADKKLSPRGVMEDNIAINAGIMIKGDAEGSVQRGNAAIGRGAYFYEPPDASNLLIANFESEQAQQTYADPLNHDFRLQSPAPASGAGEVFFVSPAGDDAAAGASLKSAWRTLSHAAAVARPGDTVYVTAGEYRETLAPAQSGAPGKPIRFLRRGHDRVVIDGAKSLPVGVNLTGRSHIVLRGFLIRDFAQAAIEARDGEGLRIENLIVTGSAGDGISVATVRDLTVTHIFIDHCQGAGLRLAKCAGATVTANVFDPCPGGRISCDAASLADLWSDANAFPPAVDSSIFITAAGRNYDSLSSWQSATRLDPASIASAPGFRDADAGRADFALRADSPLIGRGPNASVIGPFLRQHANRPLPIEDITLHDAGSSTSTVEWRTPTKPAETTLEWGEDPACSNKISAPAGVFHTASLTNLKPGATYYYRVTSPKPDEELVFAPFAAKSREVAATAPPTPLSFQTTSKPAEPHIYHVTTTGDDHRNGLSMAESIRTINHAADIARAGDTVLIHAGIYEETVMVRSSGSEAAPIIFRAAPGEVVWMDGSRRFRSTAFILSGKHYVEIDGLRFHHFRYAPDLSPVIQINGGSHLTVGRCLHDGRESQGYVPVFIGASGTEDLLVENTVMINGMGEGLTALRCPGITIRHCVFYNNFIRALTVMQFNPKLLVNLSQNLFCDNIPKKTYNAFLRISPLDSLRSDHNAYFARLGPTERNVVETSSIAGKTVGKQGLGMYHGQTLVLADVQQIAAQDQTSRFANPGIPAAPTLLPSGARESDWLTTEMHWDGKNFAPLDFPDFFPATKAPSTAPSAAEPSAGLEPEAFRAILQ